MTEQERFSIPFRAPRRGESRLTPQIARKVMDQFLPTRGLVRVRARCCVDKKTELNTEMLTDKEEKILRFITDGSSNRQIAAAMFLAEGTVKNYVSRIMEKLHANTRTAFAVLSAKQQRAESK